MAGSVDLVFTASALVLEAKQDDEQKSGDAGQSEEGNDG